MTMRGNLVSVAEMLENRRMLAASVSASGSVLTIQGDSTGQNVELYESHTSYLRQTRVSLDANGNGSFTDPGDINGAIYNGIETIVTRLGLGNDRLSITLADPMDGATRNYDLKTGAGNDVVRFTNPKGNDIRNSNLRLTLDTAGGNDDVTLALNRMNGASLAATVSTGDGDDRLTVYGSDDIANASVRVQGWMGLGNDTAQDRLDWEGFDLIGASSVWQTAFHGEDGNDLLSVTGELGNSSGDVAGTLDLGLYGDAGDDTVAFALDRLTLRGGTLRLRGNGFAGNDRLSLTGSIEGSGTLDAALRGNGGNDVLTVNANSTVGSLLLDGGAGIDSAITQGSLQVQRVNVEG